MLVATITVDGVKLECHDDNGFKSKSKSLELRAESLYYQYGIEVMSFHPGVELSYFIADKFRKDGSEVDLKFNPKIPPAKKGPNIIY
jgi:hypothetical protein